MNDSGQFKPDFWSVPFQVLFIYSEGITRRSSIKQDLREIDHGLSDV